ELAGPALAAALKETLPPPPPSRLPPPETGGGFLSGLGRDFRHGARRLLFEPGFSAVAVLSLALGVGANTAIFQLLDAVRLRNLPVAQPEKLYNVRIEPTDEGRTGNFSGRWPQLTSAIWERIRTEQKAFSKLAVWSSEPVNLASGGEARYAEGMWVSGTFFDTIGVGALRGRMIGPAEDTPDCASPAVVLSERFWRRELGGRDLAPGETISVEGRRFEIAGVAPARFFGIDVGRSFDIALPVCAESLLRDFPRTQQRRAWWLSAVGRLAPGWTLEKTNTYFKTISPGVFEATLPEGYDAKDAKNFLGFHLKVWPASDGFSDLREGYANPLWLLLGISALVLLIACANIANLMLARASARQREIAVRLALGASRRRLIRQLLAESLVLAAAGAAGGVALARILSRLLVMFLATRDDSWFVAMPLDLRLLAFTAGVAVLTCVLFGLLPAVQASRTDPIEAIKAGGRGVAGAGARLSVRRALVVSQVALSLVLLVGSFLFVRSLGNLLALDAGFQQDRILTVSTDFTRVHVPKERWSDYRREILERIGAVPGVTSAAAVRIVPLSGDFWNTYVDVEGTDVKRKAAYFSSVSPGYFRTMGTLLLAGRDFDQSDRKGSEPVAIVTQAFAKKYLGGSSPIGRFVSQTRQDGVGTPQHFRIVGLVHDTKYGELREDFQPIVFLPQAQDEGPRSHAAFVLRSDLPLSALRGPLSRAIASLSPDIAIEFRLLRDIVHDDLVRDRLMASLSAFFGFLAAVLAMVGLYGIVSFMVVRRKNEIGVRMALGATRRDILTLVLREAGTLLAAGIAIGIVLAIGAATFARSLLFGLKPTDPATIAMASAALAVVAVAASLLPAHRAAALDPVAALRED
ncbi:MAG TPA: ABC transporter permease, partial [Thermoanaerobaculia bacterium]|nr:ABC transporter permease [Thermoanaerobaculia bacterium]